MFPREALAAAASSEAARGLHLGTSSWKYEGWLGRLYVEESYRTRGRFSRRRFEAECLREYAEVFPAVCVDAGYYAFPRRSWLESLAGLVPETFRFGFKVTDDITIKRFPKLPRHGPRGGMDNPHFLNAELFVGSFLEPLSVLGDRAGPLIFEFSPFDQRHFARGRDFVAALEAFLAELPKGPAYAVEVRNASLLHPDYFAMLASHGVAHVFNSWTRMPALAEQIAMPGAFTTDFFVARLLLRPGRTYEEAVALFAPYTHAREPLAELRQALRHLLQHPVSPDRPSSVFVNNRLEGNSLDTIAAVLLGDPVGD